VRGSCSWRVAVAGEDGGGGGVDAGAGGVVEGREGVFLVAAQGGDVGGQRGAHGGEVGEAEGGVGFFNYTDGVAFEVGEGELVEAAGGDLRDVAEERVEDGAVAFQDDVGERGVVGFLEVGVPEDGFVEVELAAVNLVRVAVDVDEAGVRKQFEDEADAGGVGRGFEEERTVFAVEVGELAAKIEEAGFPGFAVGGFGVVEGEEFLVVLHAVRERHAEVERAQGEEGGGEFLFLRGTEAERHVVHETLGRNHPGEAAGADFLGGEEGGGVDDLVGVGEGETRVGREEVVQMGGAAAPVSEDEHGRLRDARGGDAGGVETAFAAGVPRVQQARRGDEGGAVSVGGGDGEAVFAEKPPPCAGGDAGEVVVTEAPAVGKGGHAMEGGGRRAAECPPYLEVSRRRT
jgi:hypothetical protein